MIAGGIAFAAALAVDRHRRGHAQPAPAGDAGDDPPEQLVQAGQAAARSAEPALVSVQVTDDCMVFAGPGGNSVVADGPDGLTIVDGGRADEAAALLARIKAAHPGRPVAGLINTHWHPEQTGLNVPLGQLGTEIIAHENTRLWLGVEIDQRWSGRRFAPLPAAGRPTTGLHASVEREIGGRPVELNYLLHAHTDGDLCAWFPDDDVLVTGGHVSNDSWPEIDWWTGGWIGGMLDGFDRLLEIADSGTRIIPARGPVMSLAELVAQHEMYLTIFDRLHTLLREARSTDEVLAARPTAEFDDRYGDPTLFVRLGFESMWGHLRDAHDTRMQNIP